jgi:alpha-beta hydrolase superfamily lysophospholipase
MAGDASAAVVHKYRAVTAFMAIVPITLFLIRVIVYFRDVYRATTYGVPDLVDIIRLIDGRLETKFKVVGRTGSRADLSFIGHSMGGFVVTNAVRILSDVFSPATKPKTRATGVIAPEDDPLREEGSEIGKAFRLKRLVCVSPDIPAEALITGRANTLHSSLSRFEEAHLFSNEADEVLANISTTANNMVFASVMSAYWRSGGITKGGDARSVATRLAHARTTLRGPQTDWLLRARHFAAIYLFR